MGGFNCMSGLWDNGWNHFLGTDGYGNNSLAIVSYANRDGGEKTVTIVGSKRSW